MDIQKLQALGMFVPATIFQREITFTGHPQTDPATWADPDVPEHEAEPVTQTITFHFRKRSSADFLELVNAPPEDQHALRLLRCVVEPDGSPAFLGTKEITPLQQVKSIHPALFFPLLAAVNEVNNVEPKKSQPRTSSGAASRSPSAAGASPNGRRPSRKKSGRSG